MMGSFCSWMRRCLPVAISALLSATPAVAQSTAGGGLVEEGTSTAVRSAARPALPDRGTFTFPAPYNTVGARLTNGADCQGNDCVNHIGYSYWRNTNNHVNGDAMLIVLTLDRARGGGGPTLFSYDKRTDAVTKVGPLFDDASPFSWGSGEGWYFSGTQPNTLYVNDTRKLYRYDVSTRQLETIFDVTSAVSGAAHLWQTHTSDDDRYHSATVRSANWDAMGCLVYREDTREVSYFAKTGAFDECQIDRSGGWLLIKQQIDGSHGEDNVVIDMNTGQQIQFMDENGAAGHSDSGHGYMIGEDNWHPIPGAVRLWRFDQPFPASQPGTPPQGLLVYRTTDWSVNAGHITHTNARADVPLDQQYACASNVNRGRLPRANEIVCFRLDGSLQVLVVAPVMTDLNAAGGGGDYGKMPKGNLDVTGRYFLWTSNVGTTRLDAFLVKVPAELLVAQSPSDAAPAPTSPAPPPPAPAPEDPVPADPLPADPVPADPVPADPVPEAPAPPGEPDPAAVAWVELVNVTATGNSLRKSSGCDGCADAGAASKQALLSGTGALEFTASETTTLRYVGLTRASGGTAASAIRFAFALQANGIAEIRESGAYRADTPFAPGDILKIGVESEVVRYYKNGQLIYQSTRAPVYPLSVDTSLFHVGATVNNVKLHGGR
jgi:hypothetical protein